MKITIELSPDEISSGEKVKEVADIIGELTGATAEREVPADENDTFEPVFDDNSEDVVQNILNLINKKGLTQKSLTDYLGIPKAVFTQWKTKQSTSYYKYIDQIAKYLDTSPNFLMGWEQPPHESKFKLNLSKLREERGLNMRQMAFELEMPYTTYISYEKGDREPNLTTLCALADYFGVSVDYLLRRKE